MLIIYVMFVIIPFCILCSAYQESSVWHHVSIVGVGVWGPPSSVHHGPTHTPIRAVLCHWLPAGQSSKGNVPQLSFSLSTPFSLALFLSASLILSFLLLLPHPWGVSAIITLIILRFLCVTVVFQCHWLEGHLSLKGTHGVFIMCNNFSACCAHEGKTGTDESTQIFIWKNWKTVFYFVLLGSVTHGSCFHWITSAAC